MTRQLAKKSTSWPTDGARMGTSMKTVMTKDMTRAMPAPALPSRTMAIETMRGAAAPKPWTKRPSSMTSKLCAARHMSEPTA